MSMGLSTNSKLTLAQKHIRKCVRETCYTFLFQCNEIATISQDCIVVVCPSPHGHETAVGAQGIYILFESLIEGGKTLHYKKDARGKF